MVYGEETFTHSMNFLSAHRVDRLGTLGRQRAWSLVLAGTLTLCAGLNGGSSFVSRSSYYALHATAARPCLIRCRRIPGDHGPGRSGTFTGGSGVSEAEHAYHEPGGDFSPADARVSASHSGCVMAQDAPLVTRPNHASGRHSTTVPYGHPIISAVPAITTKDALL